MTRRWLRWLDILAVFVAVIGSILIGVQLSQETDEPAPFPTVAPLETPPRSEPYRVSEPYRMTVRTAAGRSTVQFAQVDPALVSPEFRVNLSTPMNEVVELGSDPLGIPECVVESFDPTIPPGICSVRVGGILYEVTPTKITVGGKPYKWQWGTARQPEVDPDVEEPE